MYGSGEIKGVLFISGVGFEPMPFQTNLNTLGLNMNHLVHLKLR